jgi:2-C-methyl-D-erythritol 4-phosphate cytidylyltransferase
MSDGDVASDATAVIAAAGSGERLGAGGPKALLEIAGRPMLEWSLLAFAQSSSVSAATVAAPPERVGAIEDLVGRVRERGESAMPTTVVAGGQSRSESVAAAARGVETELTIVHDAARPLVTPELIDAVAGKLAAAEGCDGVIAASPITDTVKQAGGGLRVERTLDRSALWAAQTPQAFRTEALRLALASGDLGAATDDAMLVERNGGTVLVHEAPPDNVKVTNELDMRVAELLLADRTADRLAR